MNISSSESSRITPLNPEYESCLDTYVKLLIYPGLHKTSEVSKLLGITPTRAQEKGERIVNSRDRVRFAKSSLWILSSEKHVVSKDLRDHLNWLVSCIQKKHDDLMKLQAWTGLRMTVSCVWWSAQGHGGPVLWPEQMKALADLNLECSFDIYFSGCE